MTGLVDACLNHRLLNLVLVQCVCVHVCVCVCMRARARVHMGLPPGMLRMRAH